MSVFFVEIRGHIFLTLASLVDSSAMGYGQAGNTIPDSERKGRL